MKTTEDQKDAFSAVHRAFALSLDKTEALEKENKALREQNLMFKAQTERDSKRLQQYEETFGVFFVPLQLGTPIKPPMPSPTQPGLSVEATEPWDRKDSPLYPGINEHMLSPNEIEDLRQHLTAIHGRRTANWIVNRLQYVVPH